MSIATKPLTYDDLLETHGDDGKRYELLGGEMFVTASPSKRHVWLTNRLVFALTEFVRSRQLGEVFHSPVDVRLSPYDVVVPDIIFLRAERLHVFGDQLVDGPPDLIVEVLSRSTRSRDLTAKMQLYARAGVQEYWIVDFESSAVHIYTLSAKGSFELAPVVEGKVTSTVLPEFEVNAAELFSGLD